jgi:hypothetical protein
MVWGDLCSVSLPNDKICFHTSSTVLKSRRVASMPDTSGKASFYKLGSGPVGYAASGDIDVHFLDAIFALHLSGGQ